MFQLRKKISDKRSTPLNNSKPSAIHSFCLWLQHWSVYFTCFLLNVSGITKIQLTRHRKKLIQIQLYLWSTFPAKSTSKLCCSPFNKSPQGSPQSTRFHWFTQVVLAKTWCPPWHNSLRLGEPDWEVRNYFQVKLKQWVSSFFVLNSPQWMKPSHPQAVPQMRPTVRKCGLAMGFCSDQDSCHHETFQTDVEHVLSLSGI